MIAKNKSTIQRMFIRIIPYVSWVHPNVITLLSLVFSILFFIAVLMHHLIFALFLLFGTLTDALDGAVARYTKKTSAFGAVLDATVDRISDTLLISAFSFAHLIPWEITLPFLVLSFLISYVRARGELFVNIKMEGIGFMERTERIIGIGLIVVVFIITKQTLIAQWTMVILVAGSLYTFFQRLFFLMRKK